MQWFIISASNIHNLLISSKTPQKTKLSFKCIFAFSYLSSKKMAHTVTTMATALNPFKPALSFKPISSFSCKEEAKTPSSVPVNSISVTKRRFFDMGVGILAASMVLASPLDADATRFQYYATVSDPPCEFSFVKSGLGYCDLAVGSGKEAPYAELINIHYTARFADDTVFDSSYKRGRALTMRIGVGKVLRGLDQGIFGGEGVPTMKVGGKRKLYIPPKLAYGSEPAGCFSGDCNVPANATLVYDINFIGIYSGNRK